MRPLIAGNWKMNGTRAEAMALAAALRDAGPSLGCDLLVCPPATVLHAVAQALHGTAIQVGGQDCHIIDQGPHTGDISPAMIQDAGATWVILGHSERRADHSETDTAIRSKAIAALAAGLTPIVCVGEVEAQRLSGNAEVVVAAQVDGSIPPGFKGAVAYEPVWAIGTGRTATDADVAAMHQVIRATLVDKLGESGRQVRILYGGSVKPGNAQALLALPEVGGALVGGASLVAQDFLAIANAAPA